VHTQTIGYCPIGWLTSHNCHAARACRKDVNTLCKAEKKEAKAKSEPALVVACLKCAPAA